MPSVSLDELLEKIPNKFSLVMVAAKRARQVKDRAPRLVDTESVNPVTVALEEILAGKIVLDGNSIHLMDEMGRPIVARKTDDLDDLLGPGAEGWDDKALPEPDEHPEGSETNDALDGAGTE